MILVFCITCWFSASRINYPRCFGAIISKQIFINQYGIKPDNVTYCTVRAANSFFVEKFKDLSKLFLLIHPLSCVHSQFSFLPFWILGIRHRSCNLPANFIKIFYCYRYW